MPLGNIALMSIVYVLVVILFGIAIYWAFKP